MIELDQAFNDLIETKGESMTSSSDAPAFHTGYFDQALDDLAGVIERARVRLADVDFDTLVGTGLSGAVVVPALALALNKQFVIVRKPHDGSHHEGHLVGHLGQRWIFVDDFVSSGRTRDRVVKEIGKWTYARMVGQYLYAQWRSGEYGHLRLADEIYPDVYDDPEPV